MSTPHLNEYFLQDKITLSQNQKGVALAYQRLLKRIRLGTDKSVPAPVELQRSIFKASKKFGSHRQEDSQEFCSTLLNCLHFDLNRVRTKPAYKELQADLTKHSVDQIGQEWFNYFKQRDDSIITDLFTGQLINKVVCTVCSHQSIAFDNFQELTLSFGNSNELDKMIDEFLNQEILENSYRCQRCQKVRKCVRKFDIHRFPNILIIHLKRFLFGRWRREKITKKVKFNNNLQIYENKYELYGIVHHYGDLNFGHYTAECRHPYTKKWYSYNDSSVYQMDKLKNYGIEGSQSGYLLFFEKIYKEYIDYCFCNCKLHKDLQAILSQDCTLKQQNKADTMKIMAIIIQSM